MTPTALAEPEPVAEHRVQPGVPPPAARPGLATWACYLSSLFLGVGFTVIGATSREIGLRPEQIGVLIAFQQAGFAMGALVSGLLGRTLGRSRILIGACLLTAGCFLAFYRVPAFVVNGLLMSGIGIGMGIFEATTDVVLIDVHRTRQARHISINKFFVTLGGTGITLYLIFLQLAWRSALAQVGAAALVVAALFALARVPPQGGPRRRLLADLQSLPRKPVMALLFAFAVLIVGVELGAMGYLPTFLVELRGFSTEGAKAGLLTFLVGVAVTRFAIGLFVRDERVAPSLLGAIGAVAVFYGALVLVDPHQPAVTLALVFLAGSAIAGTLPLLVALAGRMFPDHSAQVIAFLKLMIPVGGMSLPYVVGRAAAASGLQSALLALPIAGLAAAGLLLLVRRLAATGD